MANLRKRRQRDYQQGGKRVAPACIIGRHKPGDHWVIRPALVGAGIVIDKVHFDLGCARPRCLATVERVWADIEGETGPLPRAMPLADWLHHHGATVPVPAGPVFTPYGDPFSPLDKATPAG